MYTVKHTLPTSEQRCQSNAFECLNTWNMQNDYCTHQYTFNQCFAWGTQWPYRHDDCPKHYTVVRLLRFESIPRSIITPGIIISPSPSLFPIVLGLPVLNTHSQTSYIMNVIPSEVYRPHLSKISNSMHPTYHHISIMQALIIILPAPRKQTLQLFNWLVSYNAIVLHFYYTILAGTITGWGYICCLFSEG